MQKLNLGKAAVVAFVVNNESLWKKYSRYSSPTVLQRRQCKFCSVLFKNEKKDCWLKFKNLLHLKPGTMYSLTSGELYCAAAATIFHDVGYLNQNHAVVLQALKRYSIQVVDVDEQFVTETVLTQTAPFKLVTSYLIQLYNIFKN